jgi:hypothetical protein
MLPKKKANENIRSINESGQGIVYDGYSLGRMRQKAEEVLANGSYWSVDFPQQSELRRWLTELAEQDLSRGYDTNLVDDLIRNIQSVV